MGNSNLDALSARETPRLCWEYETDKAVEVVFPLTALPIMVSALTYCTKVLTFDNSMAKGIVT